MRVSTILLVCCLSFVAARHYESTLSAKAIVHRQKLVLDLYVTPLTHSTVETVITAAKEWSFDKYKETYENEEIVEKFLVLYNHGFVPYTDPFVPTDPELMEQAIALYNVLFHATDFETFFKVSSWARQNINAELFYYAFNIAVSHRYDTSIFRVPPMFEIFPHYFIPGETTRKIDFLKAQNGISVSKDIQNYYGIEQEDNHYTIYSNYSGWYSHVNDEQKLSYFTEDRYLNNYYNYLTNALPFWNNRASVIHNVAEWTYIGYQMAIARYYNERLSNGLGEIPRFEWDGTFKTGYSPSLDNSNGIPLPTRPNYYKSDNVQFSNDINKLKDFESYIRQGIQQGYSVTKNGTVEDLRNTEGFRYLLNLFFKTDISSNTLDYTVFASSVLGISKYTYTEKKIPSVLELPYTALRDPMFYQFYSRLVQFVFMYQEYLNPYTVEELSFKGVEIKDVKVDKLITYFDYSDFPVAGNNLTRNEKLQIFVRQPKLNHSPFVIKLNIHSEMPASAITTIFFGPKYDCQNREINFNKNRQNFYVLDQFYSELVVGENIIDRKSEDFIFFNKFNYSFPAMYEMAASGNRDYFNYDLHLFPEHLMLPKGTKGGFPYQIFVVTYPRYKNFYEWKDVNFRSKTIYNIRNILYPFDIPIDALNFIQPNMYTKDVAVYHYGDDNVHTYGTPYHYHGDWYGKDLKNNQSLKN